MYHCPDTSGWEGVGQVTIRKPGDLPGSVELYSALDRGRSVTTGPLCTMASYEASPDLIQPRQSKSRGFLLPAFSASHAVACCGQGSAGSIGYGLRCGSGQPAGGAFAGCSNS